MTMATLSPAAKARLLELIETQPDAFILCLGELAGDSVLADNAKDARSRIEAHYRACSHRPYGAMSLAAIADCDDDIYAFEAVQEAAKIIETAKATAKAAIVAAE